MDRVEGVVDFQADRAGEVAAGLLEPLQTAVAVAEKLCVGMNVCVCVCEFVHGVYICVSVCILIFKCESTNT